MPTDKGNHSRTVRHAETANTQDCTLCYTIYDLEQKFRLCLTAQCAELVHQHLFDEFTATHVACLGQFVQSINGISVQFQFDTLKPANFIAFKLITFVNT